MRPSFAFVLIQLLFTLTWTVYVAFLPQLAASAGIDRSWVAWILMADQVMFIVMDLVLGAASDRVAAATRRLGPWMLAINAMSCAAFVAMPFLAGFIGPAGLLAAIVAWSLTSSALRAPLMALIAKRASAGQATRLTMLAILGIGVAGALGPLLTTALRGIDARVPFVLAGVGLLAASAALPAAEGAMNEAPDHGVPGPAAMPGAAFVSLAFLACLGFQVHTALNAAPFYLRAAKPADLDGLLPWFWVGFSLVIVPAGTWIGRVGAPRLLSVGLVLCAAGATLLVHAAELGAMLALQALGGAAWALVMACMITGAQSLGRAGVEGRATAVVFALIAAAAAVRLGLVATGAARAAPLADWLAWLPVLCWSLALLCALAWARGQGGALMPRPAQAG